MRWVVGVLLAAVVLVAPATAEAARLVRVAGGFDATVHVTKKKGDLYVVEQEGQIWRRANGSRTLFLDIRSNVACCGEEGLLSLAFDGVYTSTGDGGGGCDPGENAQDTSSWLGKLFSMNPRNLGAGRRMEIYGLRNPYRFSFDRATGRFYLADVGQNAWEEINTQNTLSGALANYGWDVFEGFAFNPCGSTTLRGPAGHHEPIDVYDHSLGCSVTGGFAYRGSDLGWLRGWYIFGDYCSGRIWRLLFRNGTLERDRRLMFDTGLNITSFGETGGGELLIAAHSGTIYRLAPNS